MGAYNDVVVTPVFTAELIAASGNAKSGIIDLGDISQIGECGLHIVMSGDGTATFEALLANTLDNNEGYFIRPSTLAEIKTGFTKTSGRGSDGVDMFSVPVIPSRYMKISVTETGTSDSVTVTAYLATN